MTYCLHSILVCSLINHAVLHLIQTLPLMFLQLSRCYCVPELVLVRCDYWPWELAIPFELVILWCVKCLGRFLILIVVLGHLTCHSYMLSDYYS